jgi:hypothetical protein
MVIKTDRSDQKEKKILFQKSAATSSKVARAQSRGHPHAPSLLVVADLSSDSLGHIDQHPQLNRQPDAMSYSQFLTNRSIFSVLSNTPISNSISLLSPGFKLCNRWFFLASNRPSGIQFPGSMATT